jgi:hypothetical protein
MRLPSCVWRTSAALIGAIDERLGVPVDSYVNGSQTWLVDNGPGGVTLEWRLHPVASYHPPRGASHYDIWETVVFELASGADPSDVRIGDDQRPLTSLWDGLECFPAYDDEVEPGPLAAAATTALGIAPDASGMVDHDRIGEQWEQTGRAVSIVDALLAELQPGPT